MGSRTKCHSVKPCKNPYQQPPQKPGMTTWTPLPPRYKPVKQLLTRDWNSVWLPPLAEEETTQQLLYPPSETAALKHLVLFPCHAFQQRRRRETQAQYTKPCFHSWGGGGLWCGRKPSVPAVLGTEDPPWALKSTQESSQQITDPEENFVSRGERVWQNKALCRMGGGKHFIAPEEEGQLCLAKVIL